MLPIKNILVATDFSPMSEHALRLGGALARDYGARLFAVHVVQPPVAVYAETAVFVEEPDFSSARESLHALRIPGVDVEYRLMEGDPAATIVQVATDLHCDLIVIGTHGRAGVVRVLMGSVAEDVLRKAPCPVLTVKASVPLPMPVEEAAAEPAHA
jgi:nucleotide-binding universal stress UspA family protein